MIMLSFVWNACFKNIVAPVKFLPFGEAVVGGNILKDCHLGHSTSLGDKIFENVIHPLRVGKFF